MAKTLKFTVQAKIDLAVESAEFDTYNALNQDFRQECLKYFIKVKDQLEDWQSATTNEAGLKARLQNIAATDPATWNENTYKKIALICTFLYNITDDA